MTPRHAPSPPPPPPKELTEREPAPPSPTLKRMFVRGKALGVKFRCLVISDGFPHWLLSLRPKDWSQIHWMQFGSCPTNLLPLLEAFLPTLKSSLVHASFDASTFSQLLVSVDIMLFSGSDSALNQVSPFGTTVPTLCIPREPLVLLGRASLLAQGLTSHRWRHRMLGGVTNGSLNVACRNVDFSAFKPPLRRNIKHILDFGLRPKDCPPSPPFKHYQSTDVIRMNELTLPVVYKSPHFCRTGWGTRALSLGELACAYDLPSHCVDAISETALLSQVFPLKLLTEPLQFVMESLVLKTPPPVLLLGPAFLRGLEPTTPADSVSLQSPLFEDVSTHFVKLAALAKPSSPTVPLMLNGIPNPAGPGIPGKRIWFHDPPGMTWLPALGKFLPDSWCDETIISDKAAKSDEDPVPHHLWDVGFNWSSLLPRSYQVSKPLRCSGSARPCTGSSDAF
jgi:hypothetical protein